MGDGRLNITLDSPEGMVILGDSLYINDRSGIVGYDLAADSVFMEVLMDTLDYRKFTDLCTDDKGYANKQRREN